MKTKCIFLFLVFLVFTGCQAPDSSEPPSSKTFYTSLDDPLTSLDWTLTGDMYSHWLESQMMQGLVEYEFSSPLDYKIVPALAESWQSDQSYKTWTFKIRPQVVWTDGVPLTARHFVEAYKRVLAPESGAADAGHLYIIDKARECNLGKVPFDSVGIKALDDQTLVFQLRDPTPHFLKTLGKKSISRFWLL